jgi:organic radical activating enzyme
MRSLPFIEVMIIRGCNLSCEGCTTFSDLKHAGYQTWEQGLAELEPWTQRLQIEAIGFMGGEPLMNPAVRDWIQGMRDLLPNAQIRFVTNGLLLHRHMDVIDLLHTVGNSVLKISQHVDDPVLINTIQEIHKKFNWEPVFEYGNNRWKTSNEFRFQVNRPERFLKTFQGSYSNMRPHNSNPAEAFDACVQQRCPMLYRGRIFKCGTVALTSDLLSQFAYPNINEWKPHLDKGLGADCEDFELERFIDNFGKPHKLCVQCPTKNDIASFVDHRKTVVFK